MARPVVAADGRSVTALRKKDRQPVRIADREAPRGALRQRGLQRTPRQPVRGKRRVGIALGLAREASEGPAQAGDALAQRHVGQAQQVGDLAAAHPQVDQQRDQPAGAGQAGDEGLRKPRQGTGRALRRDGIGVLPPFPPRGRPRRELRAVADGARGPGQEARVAAVAVLLDRGEQDVLHQVLGLVRDHRAARRHPRQGLDGSRREPTRRHPSASAPGGAHEPSMSQYCLTQPTRSCDTPSPARCSASCRYRQSPRPGVRTGRAA